MEQKHNSTNEIIKKYSEKIKSIFNSKGGNNVLVVLVLTGILLISVPSFLPKHQEIIESNNSPPTREDYGHSISKQLEEILGKIDGVGNIKVMVTIKQDSSYVYATDLTRNEQQENMSAHLQTEETHVIIEQDGEEKALVSTCIAPQVEGVIIVCEGGNDPVVINKLTKAVTAALDIGSNRVAVSNMNIIE